MQRSSSSAPLYEGITAIQSLPSSTLRWAGIFVLVVEARADQYNIHSVQLRCTHALWRLQIPRLALAFIRQRAGLSDSDSD